MNRIAELEGLPILEAYSDGGMVGSKNPSDLGVTWAWCHVVHPGLRSVMGAGVITPQEAGIRVLSNNHAEYAAAVRCLRALPEGWSGPFYCDSEITIARIFGGWSSEPLPRNWEEAAARALARLGTVEPVLIAGHPNKAQLVAGKKGELPVSRHNVWCDAECGRQAQAYLAERLREAGG